MNIERYIAEAVREIHTTGADAGNRVVDHLNEHYNICREPNDMLALNHKVPNLFGLLGTAYGALIGHIPACADYILQYVPQVPTEITGAAALGLAGYLFGHALQKGMWFGKRVYEEYQALPTKQE